MLKAFKEIIFTLALFYMSSLNAADVIFKGVPLSEELKQEMLKKGVWKEKCPVSLDRLRLLTLSYYDFAGVVHTDGKMVVLDAVAERVLNIFRELYDHKFPIAKIRLIECYNGDDDASMADNNSSCFNYRVVAGTSIISMHGYAVAIDINPWQNPCYSPEEEVAPAEGKDYLDRTDLRPGMVEEIVDIFKKNGFTIWGGNWRSLKDWQHFQPPSALAKLLVAMTPAEAKELFEMHVKERKLFNTINPKKYDFAKLYRKNPARFMDSIRKKPSIFAMNPEDD